MPDTVTEEPKKKDKTLWLPEDVREEKEQDKPTNKRWWTARRVAWAAGGFIVLVALVVLLWIYLSSYESTDDAQIDGHIDAISSRIAGYVVEVPVEEGWRVKAGDVLARIDPKDYLVAQEKAQADLADAEANLASLRPTVPITTTQTTSQLESARAGRSASVAAVAGAERQLDAARARLTTAGAQVRAAEADYKKSSDDVARYDLLVRRDEIPRQQYDYAVSAADAARAALDARRAGVSEAAEMVRVAESNVEEARQRVTQADAQVSSASTAPQQVASSKAKADAAAAQVDQRRAALEQARLNVGYCTIVSLVNGIVGKKTVQVGQNVSPGQELMAVVPEDDLWIIANFKETQLRKMHEGQRVKFSVDALDRVYYGTIEAMGGASGERFSVLPPENATGNYVKVVQRIPVRIRLDANQNNDLRLRPGMSVTPKVYLK